MGETLKRSEVDEVKEQAEMVILQGKGRGVCARVQPLNETRNADTLEARPDAGRRPAVSE
jgi:hypothetical protein